MKLTKAMKAAAKRGELVNLQGTAVWGSVKGRKHRY